MSYSTDVAKLLADQLERFVTLNRHQLVGHVANLDFWLVQVRQALAVLDGYGERFVRMHTAQEKYVDLRGTVEFELERHSTEYRASPPRRVPDHELRKARRSLTAAVTRFLNRCQKEGLIADSEVTEAFRSLGIE